MIKKIVTFCSANNTSEYFELAYKTGKVLAENNFTVITGGGPGLMQKVNQGAFECRGESIGICIKKKDEKLHKYFTKTEMFESFDKRHSKLLNLGDAYIVLPGGLGTILEALEITQRKRFGEINVNKPLIFIGDFFKDFLNFLKDLEKKGFISEDKSNSYYFAKNPNDLIKILKKLN